MEGGIRATCNLAEQGKKGSVGIRERTRDRKRGRENGRNSGNTESPEQWRRGRKPLLLTSVELEVGD
jgi:hypothetical protein